MGNFVPCWSMANCSIIFIILILCFCHWRLSLNNVFATMLSWEFGCWLLVRFIFGCLVSSPYWLVHCCIQGFLTLYCPLRSACVVYALCFALPYEFNVVWLFFTFNLGELRNKWVLAFWINICPFSTQKCQCSAASLASVREKMWILEC